MSGFHATAGYNPALVLTLGMLAFSGFLALGRSLLRASGVWLPSPWGPVCALIVGVLSTSLLVQLTGIAGLAVPGALSAIGIVLLAGGARLLFQVARDGSQMRIGALAGIAFLPLLALALSVAACALVALAPSSKIDEIYYHMLVPSRILADGALLFYKEPWEGAILPQMLFQIATAPLHAIGFPDAGNVVGWLFGVGLLWFTWRVVRAAGRSLTWACVCTGALATGLYAAVWHVTAGAHSMGALALAAATVAFCSRDRLAVELGTSKFAVMFSLLALGAASTKVTLLPLTLLMLLLVAYPMLRRLRGIERKRAALGLALPWAIFLLPIVAWTWAKSGAPFGPMLSDLFPSSVFGAGWTAALFEEARAVNDQPLATVLFIIAIDYSPLLFAGILGALFHSRLSPGARFELGALFVFQGAVIVLLLLPNMRYFGGLHYGLAIVFAAHAKPEWDQIATSPRIVSVLAATLLIPWVAVQGYYAQQFAPIALGIGQKEAFYQRYIAFYGDYQSLQRLLPRDASIFTRFRAGFFYSPRPVYADPDDLPRGRPVYALVARDDLPSLAELLPGFRQQQVVYENSHAISVAYRTPGRSPLFEDIVVVRMTRD